MHALKNNEVIKRLKAIRTGNGYTQSQFAEILDMSYDGYKKMERGDVRIPIDKLVLIEERLNVPAEYIIFGKKDEFDELWLKSQMLSDKDKLRFFMRLYSYFINVKKSYLVEASDIEMTEELFEKLLSSVENKDDKQTE